MTHWNKNHISQQTRGSLGSMTTLPLLLENYLDGAEINGVIMYNEEKYTLRRAV